MKKETETIDKEDIIKVANSIHIELTEKEIEEVAERYSEGCTNDPCCEWVLIVEQLVYEVLIVEQLVYEVFNNRNNNV